MTENQEPVRVLNIARAFLSENADCAAALFNAYFQRRKLAGLPDRLTGVDIERMAQLLHWGTPPEPMKMTEMPEAIADIVTEAVEEPAPAPDDNAHADQPRPVFREGRWGKGR